METNDQMLKQFFSEQKQEFADNGFSRRVMRNLPETADRSWIVWIFAAIGMAISIYFGLSTGLFGHVLSLILKSVPYYYLLAAVFCFPLLGTAGYYLSQNKNYQVI